MRRRVPLLLCALLLVCVPLVGVTPAAAQPEAEGTQLEAQLQDDGDAAWNVTLTVPIDDGGDREDFEAFAERFEGGEAGLELGVGAFERAASEASAASDREMHVRNVTRDSAVVDDGDGGEYGELRVAFTWESFARVDGDGTLRVDDAFNTTDGTWLPGLGADQSLVIRAPPGYGGPTTSPIGADGGDLRWDGPRTFEPGYFTIVYHPSSAGTTAGVSDTLVTGALVLSGVALVLGLYLLLARRRGGDDAAAPDGPAADAALNETATGAGDTAATGPDDGADPDSKPEPGADGVDPELLSDEERVEHLLDRNGGRMKQATIVKETGWSNAKVSQLLSSMDDADRVDKLRIGRENLISLPGENVGEIGDDEG